MDKIEKSIKLYKQRKKKVNQKERLKDSERKKE